MLGSRGIWRKIKSIGKGSFGQVYLVRRNNDTSSKMFVMKEVRLAGLPPKELSAAKAEVAALKKVSHPHIIKYEDSLVQDETLCIVMEYAAGKDLSALIAKRKQENKPLEEKEVLKIFYQVCSALSYCHHDLKMLHRDLKPQNIFLTGD